MARIPWAFAAGFLCLAAPLRAAQGPPESCGSDAVLLSPDVGAAKTKLCAAIDLLRTTESGRGLLDLAGRHGTRIKAESGENDVDGAGDVTIDPDGVAPAEAAITLAHELEHVRQFQEFKAPLLDSFDNQWGAVLRECQVWTELGFPEGGKKILRLWLANPAAARWVYERGQSDQSLDAVGRMSDEQFSADRDYLSSREEEVDSWRRRRAEELARRRMELGDQTPLFESLLDALVLLDSVRGHAGGSLSPGFYGLLGRILDAREGEEIALPAPLTAKELEVLSYLPVEVLVYESFDGRWRLRRGNEISVASRDLAGTACVAVHNHPSSPQEGAAGLKARVNFPSDEDFLHRAGKTQFLILPIGVLRYDREERVRDPFTGVPSDPTSVDEFTQELLTASEDPNSWLRKHHRPGTGIDHAYRVLGFTTELTAWDEATPFQCPEPSRETAGSPRDRIGRMLEESADSPFHRADAVLGAR